MPLLVVIVGIDHWSDFTSPLIKGLRKYNPCFISLVDNASQLPYPRKHADALLRLEKRVGYAQAINLGVNCWDFDWMLLMNNDCECSGTINLDLSDYKVWGGSYLHEQGIKTLESGWMLIPRKIWNTVRFDDKYEAAFEDYDFTERALRAGFELGVTEQPLKHLAQHTRYETENYTERWNRSFELFQKNYRR
jgi:GT2 family glycosyltransferase